MLCVSAFLILELLVPIIYLVFYCWYIVHYCWYIVHIVPECGISEYFYVWCFMCVIIYICIYLYMYLLIYSFCLRCLIINCSIGLELDYGLGMDEQDRLIGRLSSSQLLS